MTNIKCGACTACCEWGEDTAIRPVLLPNEVEAYRHETIKGVVVLEATPKGNCIYMRIGLKGEKGGCRIHHKRPAQCRRFDCRVLFKQMDERTFIKVIVRGSIKIHETEIGGES